MNRGLVLLAAAGVLLPAAGSSAAGAAACEDRAGTFWAAVEQRIADSEYEVRWQSQTVIADLPASWHAPNRQHGFRTYFTPTGIRVVPRLQASPSWEWGLSLVGWGRGERIEAVGRASVAASGNRFEYARDGLVEWYVNDARGLEQGFTLAAPPAGDDDERSDGAPARLHLALSGTLSPIVSADGRAVEFVAGPGVAVLRYAQLVVHDASGTELRSWIEASNHGGRRALSLVFDDRGATYPVNVDPVATTPAWIGSSGQPGSHFGESVATAGDVNGDGFADVIVGAHLYDNGQSNEGAAFVFHGSPAGLDTRPAWTAESDHVNGEMGLSVATAGDVNGDGYSDVIVGIPGFGVGIAHIYHGSPAGLGTQPASVLGMTAATSWIGAAVSTAGDVNGDGYSDVIVGASQYTNGQGTVGRADVYHGSAAGLAQTPAWVVVGNQVGGDFGARVATAGDVDGDGYADVLVSGQDNPTTRLYRGGPAGLETTQSWSFFTAFFPNAMTAGDVNGDGYADVVLGDSWEYNDDVHEGMVFLFNGSPSGLTGPSWTAEGDSIDEGLGWAVGTAGDVNGDGYADIIVGRSTVLDLEPGGDSDFFISSHVYLGSALGLEPDYPWSGPTQGGSYGWSVGTAGDVNGDGYSDVIVGGWGANSAQVFHGSAAGLAPNPRWSAEGGQAGAKLGVAVGAAGDVNGDGFADVIVGASDFDGLGDADAGMARVWRGSGFGLAPVATWTTLGSQPGAGLGTSVATAGDVDGDGYSDVIVGVPGYDNGEADEGRAFVYRGSSLGPSTSPDWSAESDQAFAHLGQAVASAGDVNGDGFADVIVGAPRYENGETDEGRAWVYLGSVAGLGQTAAWTAEGDQASAQFAAAVAGAGDVNGDGFADVIVGAPFHDNGEADEGAAFVYHGSASGLGARAAWGAEGDQASAQFGAAVAGAGDVNGDGFADVIVGAPFHDNGEADEGAAFVYHGSVSGLAADAAWNANGHQAGAHFGESVAGAGDVNGDGFADVVVGAPGYDNGESDEGRALAYHGSSTGLSLVPAWTAEFNQASAGLGGAVAGAGDVNGDGYADVIVGADGWDNGQSGEGLALLFYGNEGLGLALRPEQRRADDSAEIAERGASEAADAFRLSLLGKTPFGRGRVRLEWEVAPLGQALEGLDTELSAAAVDTGTSGVVLNELQTGLALGTAYHWRVRLRYDLATAPYGTSSRWLRIPWDGWQEADLRTSATPAAGVFPDGSRGTPLTVGKDDADLVLSWGSSCVATDGDAAIYEGTLGSFTSHVSRQCSTGGRSSFTLTPAPGDTYYLVVPHNGAVEGSYGVDGAGAERAQAADACFPQAIGGCP